MEIKEAEKAIIARPVPYRPGFLTLKSCSALLTDAAVDASLPAVLCEAAAAALRPRTLRFNKPAELFGCSDRDPSGMAPESNVIISNVVYRPVAKLVSKKTVNLLANLGNYDISPSREVAEVGTRIELSNQEKLQNEMTPDFDQNSSPHLERKRSDVQETDDDDAKSLSLPNHGHRPCYDGHNWRKYGQKQVKGSQYPRSYYRCTHPNCPVKKKVEVTLDGKIAGIVYEAEHNHSKPQPLKQTHNEAKSSLWTNQQAERTEVHEGKLENQKNNESSAKSIFCRAAPRINGPVTAVMCNASASNNSLGLSGECEEVSKSLEAEGDDFKSKRRKHENHLDGAGAVGQASSEPRVVVQKNTDSQIIGDGFRWRKYGQKVVKGNRYPRSYYRCTSPKCNVRKYVERTSELPGAFITTYEGRHNHDIPIKGANLEAAMTSTEKKP